MIFLYLCHLAAKYRVYGQGDLYNLAMQGGWVSADALKTWVVEHNRTHSVLCFAQLSMVFYITS